MLLLLAECTLFVTPFLFELINKQIHKFRSKITNG